MNTNADLVEGILSFDCVVGQKGCIYTDKNSLAKGKMDPSAKNKLIKTLIPIKNNKPQIHSKVTLPKVNPSKLAQTSQKQSAVSSHSKSINKDLHPTAKLNLQQKAQMNRDNALERKQK